VLKRGLQAFVGVFSGGTGNERFGVRAAFIALGGRLYQVAGVATVAAFSQADPAFRSTIASFRGMSAAEAASYPMQGVVSSDWLATNFGVLNHSTFGTGSPAARLRALIRQAFVAVSVAVWWFEDTTGLRLPATRGFSPYAVCVAVRKA